MCIAGYDALSHMDDLYNLRRCQLAKAAFLLAGPAPELSTYLGISGGMEYMRRDCELTVPARFFDLLPGTDELEPEYVHRLRTWCLKECYKDIYPPEAEEPMDPDCEDEGVMSDAVFGVDGLDARKHNSQLLARVSELLRSELAAKQEQLAAKG